MNNAIGYVKITRSDEKNMLYNKKISLVIPCRNEEAALYSLLNKVPDYVDEIIVVDNNSTDNTVRVARANGAQVIREKRHVNGVGYGFAHQKGMGRASGDYIVTMDGDDTYPVEKIKDIITYMDKNRIDFVSCNRLPFVNGKNITFMRRIGIRILNLEIALLYRFYFNDILTGMWVMKKEIIGKLQVKSGDWNFSPEIKVAALYNRDIRFSEYHIPYYLRINGVSKLNMWRTGFDHFFFILKRKMTVDNSLSMMQVKGFTFQTVKSARNILSLIF